MSIPFASDGRTMIAIIGPTKPAVVSRSFLPGWGQMRAARMGQSLCALPRQPRLPGGGHSCSASVGRETPAVTRQPPSRAMAILAAPFVGPNMSRPARETFEDATGQIDNAISATDGLPAASSSHRELAAMPSVPQGHSGNVASSRTRSTTSTATGD